MNLHDRLVFPRTSLDITKDNFEKSFVSFESLFILFFVFIDDKLVLFFFWILFIISFRQYTSVRKAINSTECPVKEKHIRSKKVCFDLMIFFNDLYYHRRNCHWYISGQIGSDFLVICTTITIGWPSNCLLEILSCST